MKTLPTFHFMLYAVIKAVRHPRTPIAYLYCPDCRLRFNANEKECPKCHNQVSGHPHAGDTHSTHQSHSPEDKREASIPWWGSVVCIVIGIGTWIASALLNIAPLGEAARVLVYIPLGSLFGLSLQR